MRAKVLQRLRDIGDLKEKFFRCLAQNSTFMPPPSVFYGEPVRSRNAATAGAKAKKTPAKKKGKGGKKGKEKGDMEDTTLAAATPNKVLLVKKKLRKSIALNSFFV